MGADVTKRQNITYYLQDRNGNRRSALLLFQIPAIERVALETAEKLLLDVGIAPLQLMDQILHLLSAGGAVGRTGVVDHRQVEPLHRAADVILPAVQQRTDLGDARAVQIRHRLEAADAPLKQQIHQQRFDGIVVVMTQCDLVDPPLRQRRIQAAPPQLGAEGAGVLFFALFKHDLVYRHSSATASKLMPGVPVSSVMAST